MWGAGTCRDPASDGSDNYLAIMRSLVSVTRVFGRGTIQIIKLYGGGGEQGSRTRQQNNIFIQNCSQLETGAISVFIILSHYSSGCVVMAGHSFVRAKLITLWNDHFNWEN